MQLSWKFLYKNSNMWLHKLLYNQKRRKSRIFLHRLMYTYLGTLYCKYSCSSPHNIHCKTRYNCFYTMKAF